MHLWLKRSVPWFLICQASSRALEIMGEGGTYNLVRWWGLWSQTRCGFKSHLPHLFLTSMTWSKSLHLSESRVQKRLARIQGDYVLTIMAVALSPSQLGGCILAATSPPQGLTDLGAGEEALCRAAL